MKKTIPKVLVSQLSLFIYVWNDKPWGSFLSGQVDCVCARGWEGSGVVFFQNSSWKVSMMLILTGVRSGLSGIWAKRGVTTTRWAAAPCLAVPQVPRFSIESWSHCLPPLSFSVLGAFFLKN